MRSDLHIHTCLSPCGDLRMSPHTIVDCARSAGLGLIGAVDHNAGLNAPAVAHTAAALGLNALTGVEVTTVEELHVLALFEDAAVTLEFGQRVLARMTKVPLSQLKGCDQPVVTESGHIEEMFPLWLGAPTDWTLTELCHAILDAGGLCIPSHVDRAALSILAQLGRIPELPFDAVEISPAYDRQRDPAGLRGRWAMIRSSDAHRPDEIGWGWTELPLERARLTEIRAALHELMRCQLRDPNAGLSPEDL